MPLELTAEQKYEIVDKACRASGLQPGDLSDALTDLFPYVRDLVLEAAAAECEAEYRAWDMTDIIVPKAALLHLRDRIRALMDPTPPTSSRTGGTPTP